MNNVKRLIWKPTYIDAEVFQNIYGRMPWDLEGLIWGVIRGSIFRSMKIDLMNARVSK